MEAWSSRHAFTPKPKRFSPASCCIVQWERSFWSTSGASPFCRLRATRHLSEERVVPLQQTPQSGHAELTTLTGQRRPSQSDGS